jgi:DNA mismatch endonuclease (patch repair protein)
MSFPEEGFRQRRWRCQGPTDGEWKTRVGLTKQERSIEQDEAAGGSPSRSIELPGGRTAMGSIELKVPPKSRRVYAYLRFSLEGNTCNRYVGQVNGETREDNLVRAWCLAREKGMLKWNDD